MVQRVLPGWRPQPLPVASRPLVPAKILSACWGATDPLETNGSAPIAGNVLGRKRAYETGEPVTALIGAPASTNARLRRREESQADGYPRRALEGRLASQVRGLAV